MENQKTLLQLNYSFENRMIQERVDCILYNVWMLMVMTPVYYHKLEQGKMNSTL